MAEHFIKPARSVKTQYANVVINPDGTNVGQTQNSYLRTIVSEAITFSAGAAGTSGVVSLQMAPVFNALGTYVGTLGDSSFSWTTGTILTAEVAFNSNLTQTEFLASLTNGQYAIDYSYGLVYYKKATTGTADSANYKSRQFLATDSSNNAYVSLGTQLSVINDQIEQRPILPSNNKTTVLAASLVVVAASCRVVEIRVTNTKASAQYIQLHNSTTLPADTSVPFDIFYVPALTTVSYSPSSEVFLSNGLVVCNSSTAATKTIGSADCWFNVDYR